MLCLVIVVARMNEWLTNAALGGLRCAYQTAAAKDGTQRLLSQRLSIQARLRRTLLHPLPVDNSLALVNLVNRGITKEEKMTYGLLAMRLAICAIC